MLIMAGGTSHQLGYKKISKILIQNKNFHNNTNCITLLAYHPLYQNVKISVGKSEPQKLYKYLKGVGGVINIVKTNNRKKEGKCFVLVDKLKMVNNT